MSKKKDLQPEPPRDFVAGQGEASAILAIYKHLEACARPLVTEYQAVKVRLGVLRHQLLAATRKAHALLSLLGHTQEECDTTIKGWANPIKENSTP